MPETHLRQPGFTYSACESFTKNKERIQRFKDSQYIYQNELDKACFQHDMAFEDFKDIIGTVSDTILHDQASNRGLASIVYIYFDKKTSGGGIQNENISSKELAESNYLKICEKESALTFYR